GADELVARLVDRLADRREQRDRVPRGNAGRRLGPMAARFLQQEVLLGPLAATGNSRAGGRQLVAGAIDEPGAGGVHAAEGGEIEDHAFSAVGRRKERRARGLQLTSGADDPLPRQRQDNPVLAGLTSYGRSRGHQALRPSRNGLISRPTGACRAAGLGGGSRQQQTKYESEPSPHGLGFANKASRILRKDRRTDSQTLPRGLGPVPFPSASRRTKHRRISHLPKVRRRSDASGRFVAGAGDRQVWLPKP